GAGRPRSRGPSYATCDLVRSGDAGWASPDFFSNRYPRGIMLERLWPSSARDNGNLGPLTIRLEPIIADVALLCARVLIGYIFVLGGWGKLLGLAGFASYLEQHGIPAGNAFA